MSRPPSYMLISMNKFFWNNRQALKVKYILIKCIFWKKLYTTSNQLPGLGDTLANYLLENTYKRGVIKTLCLSSIQGLIYIVAQVYVDDIIFASTN